MKKLGLIVILSILAFLLVSCSNSNSTIQTTPVINVPVTLTTYEVYDHPTGVQMEEYVIEKEQNNNFEAWQEKQQLIEQLDEYETKTKVWNEQKKKLEEGDFWSEEDRIEQYCLDHGYLKCIKITETCLKAGCYKVTIECEDDDFDATELEWDDYDKKHDCKEYNVVVEEEPYKTSSCY